MDSDISGFFSQVDSFGAPDLATFTPIPTSEGSPCELYRGERAGRFRVYKCLKPKFRGNPLMESLLRKEFEQGYSLRHQNICEFYSYMEVEGKGNCIEMEWIDGISLAEYLKRGRPGEKAFQRIAAQLCDALGYIHSRGMLHRDLKPSNIMISHDGSIVKLIDFGLADDASSSLFKAPAGTKGWVAPEVMAGGKADVRSDIYSLGAVLRQMTDGHRRCLDRCTVEDPARRYGSAEDVSRALASRSILWPAIVAAALAIVLAMTIYLIWNKRLIGEATPQEQPVRTSTVDTIYVLPAAQEPAVSQQPSTPSQKKTAPQEQNAPATDIDEIFEQASGLFEENL